MWLFEGLNITYIHAAPHMTKSLWLVSMEFSVLFQTAHLFCVDKLEDIGEISLEGFHLTLKHVLLAYEYIHIY